MEDGGPLPAKYNEAGAVVPALPADLLAVFTSFSSLQLVPSYSSVLANQLLEPG